MTKTLVLDIETNGFNPDKIFVIVCKDIKSHYISVFTCDTTDTYRNLDECAEFISGYDYIIMHNGIGFDAPVLYDLLDITIPINKIIDTLVYSRLANPVRDGGHSLAAWGERLSYPKISFEDFSGLSDDMIKYCIRDVDVTHEVYLQLEKDLKGFSDFSIRMEHLVAHLINIQIKNGFYFNEVKASGLVAILQEQSTDISNKLINMFPPKEIVLKTKTKYEPFNPNSRQQIGEQLLALGWEPSKFTEKTNLPIVNEQTLEECTIPIAKDFQKLFLINKRLAQVKSWIEAMDTTTNRVHGKVRTIGTITGRMSHNSPNMAQVPASYSPYGKECRELWCIEDQKKYRLVGADASGLELRCLAHYMNDPDFTNEVLSGDIHTANMKAAGLTDRDQAKTFIYAFLYGAGPAKIGSIVNGGAKEGQKLIKRFLKNLPKLATLRENVTRQAEEHGYIIGLDGRHIIIRHQHAALNTLLQGAGSIICKQWLIEICKLVEKRELNAHPVANIHDEVQFEVSIIDAGKFSSLTKDAMKITEKVLNVKCPLDSEAKIGTSWKETH